MEGAEEIGSDELSAAERLAEAKTSGTAAAVRVDTKQLWKSLRDARQSSDCLVGVAGNKGHVELVYRFDRQAVTVTTPWG